MKLIKVKCKDSKNVGDMNERQIKEMISQAVNKLHLPGHLKKEYVKQEIWEAILNHDFEYSPGSIVSDIYYYLKDNGML